MTTKRQINPKGAAAGARGQSATPLTSIARLGNYTRQNGKPKITDRQYAQIRRMGRRSGSWVGQ